MAGRMQRTGEYRATIATDALGEPDNDIQLFQHTWDAKDAGYIQMPSFSQSVPTRYVTPANQNAVSNTLNQFTMSNIANESRSSCKLARTQAEVCDDCATRELGSVLCARP
jgi:hypothetical protein